MESRDSKQIGDGRALKVNGRAQALVSPDLATLLPTAYIRIYCLTIILLQTYECSNHWHEACTYKELAANLINSD